MRPPEVGLPLLGGARRPQRKPRARTSPSTAQNNRSGWMKPEACAGWRCVAPPALLGTARSWRGIVPLPHLAREGRMTVTIGPRELLVALGGAVAAWPLAAG